ncbi:MAG: group II intron reverse transcriptase/maturase, partial [Actinobacteria bacterium]|nr:group II intron reverse transcriptase/maturase [Actinomycetota bacterium]
MGDKRQKIQMELAFTAGRTGEAPTPERKGTESSLARYEAESLAKSKRLMEDVCEPRNLKQALRRVKANAGSPGIDRMTTEELAPWLIANWSRIREELIAGHYQPQPVRRKTIDKPDGGTRELGIPTVIDRFVQQAVLQILERIWDPTFSESSYGFRAQRSAHQAIEAAQGYIREGYRWVVDIDLEKFFDRVNHDRLMARLATRVGDTRLLRLIRSFLESGVMVGGLVSPSEEGTPQGGPLSPLLSNIVLDELDGELEKRGHKFARYADDCNIYVRSERAGKRVMESLRRLITSRLRLRINEGKSAVARPQQRKFLGFSFTNERNARRRIAPKALTRFKERVREITGRTRGRSLNHVIEELREYLTGWRGYFGFCETSSVLKNLDGWIRRRLRAYLWKQWKTFDRRRTELQRRGVDHDKA